MLSAAAATPPVWMILPFALLLGTIALAPLVASAWWSRHYPKVAFGLGAITVGYYLFGLHAGARVWHTAEEYFSFICLVGSLYVVSGGIHLKVKGGATPLENTVFLAVGAVLANFFGTTGASMLMIRPWIRMNKMRITAHHIVFFIFIVSNVGGALTPIGDPPLFLGYLKGVPFWWVAAHCWPMWTVALGLLLGMFLVVDFLNFRRVPPALQQEARQADQWTFQGTANLAFLAVILGAVFLSRPPFLREFLMLAAAAGSYWTTPRPVHEANHFEFHPVKEVAILFIGIFATMMPALDWLEHNAAMLGTPTPALFFWGSGTLSSVLDNAPTYLSFLSAGIGALVTPAALAQGQAVLPALSASHPEIAALLADPALVRLLMAISMGAVFFGANTYIGNGPNFMVKAIADQQGCHTPTFLGYVGRFTLPFMGPVLIVVWWVFFR
ncbi:MAG: sodium:proton antiporter [Verrucomicrobia bacterium]|nr:sodium:proton antiporter [Verrucomicrobiota bacterium]